MISMKKMLTKILTTLSTKITKTGDKVTGNYKFKSIYTRGTSPTDADKVDQLIQFIDQREVQFGRFGVYTAVNGRDGIQIGAARTPTGGSSIGNLLTLLIDDAGNRYVQFSAAAPWLTALGLNGVGTYKSAAAGSSGTYSLASATAHNFASVSLEPGVWQVTGTVTYNAGASTGTYRRAAIGNASSDYAISQIGASASNTNVNVTTPIDLRSATGNTTVYIRGQHGQGANINVVLNQTWIKAVRIK